MVRRRFYRSKKGVALFTGPYFKSLLLSTSENQAWNEILSLFKWFLLSSKNQKVCHMGVKMAKVLYFMCNPMSHSLVVCAHIIRRRHLSQDSCFSLASAKTQSSSGFQSSQRALWLWQTKKYRWPLWAIKTFMSYQIIPWTYKYLSIYVILIGIMMTSSIFDGL